jgi:hypothetical protein
MGLEHTDTHAPLPLGPPKGDLDSPPAAAESRMAEPLDTPRLFQAPLAITPFNAVLLMSLPES